MVPSHIPFHLHSPDPSLSPSTLLTPKTLTLIERLQERERASYGDGIKGKFACGIEGSWSGIET